MILFNSYRLFDSTIIIKSELYNLLTREGKYYLPPKQYSTQKYLRDIFLGKKLNAKWENISVTKVPNYKGLQVSEIVRFAESNFRINDY